MVFVVGLIASLFVIMLSFTIQRRNIVLISSMLAVATMTQYALLGKYSTMLLAVVALLYGFTTLFEHRFPVLSSRYVLVVLVAAYSAVFFVVNGIQINVEIVAYVASLTSVLIMAAKNQLLVKWLMLVNGFAWLFYQLNSGAYGQLPGEIFYTIGVLFSMAMLYRAKNAGIDLNTVPEFSTIIKNRLQNTFINKSKIVKAA